MKILIVAPAWVGDMVMAHSLVGLLRKQHGEVSIDLLAPPATAPLATRMPGVQDVHTLAVGHGELGLGARRSCARTLARLDYDHAIVLPNSFKSALVPYFARIPRRTGWTGEARWVLLNDRRTLDRGRYALMIERFMALALAPEEVLEKPYPQPALRVDRDNTERLRVELALGAAAPTVLCPATSWSRRPSTTRRRTRRARCTSTPAWATRCSTI